jgi:hypothetical protein
MMTDCYQKSINLLALNGKGERTNALRYRFRVRPFVDGASIFAGASAARRVMRDWHLLPRWNWGVSSRKRVGEGNRFCKVKGPK